MDAFVISKDADTRALGAALAAGGYKREAYWRFAAAELFQRPMRYRPGTRLRLTQAALTLDLTRERSSLPTGPIAIKNPARATLAGFRKFSV